MTDSEWHPGDGAVLSAEEALREQVRDLQREKAQMLLWEAELYDRNQRLGERVERLAAKLRALEGR